VRRRKRKQIIGKSVKPILTQKGTPWHALSAWSDGKGGISSTKEREYCDISLHNDVN
jgi:hypothetical protein